MQALTLRPEQHQQFGGPGTGAAVPGVWAAGNLANPQAQVVTSAAAGLAAGAAINLDLITEDAGHAVSARRRQASRGGSGQARHGRPGHQAHEAPARA